MTALKWPRPGGFHIRDAILARRHSWFSHFFGKICDGKPSILRFFARNATALNWRRPGAGAFGTSFWRVVASSKSHRALSHFWFLTKKMCFLEPQKSEIVITVRIPGPKKEGSLKRAKIAVPRVGFTFYMRFRRPPWPRPSVTRFRLPDRCALTGRIIRG